MVHRVKWTKSANETDMSDMMEALHLNERESSNTDVNIKTEEHPPESLSSSQKQHHVRKWFRTTFKWCTQVLSLHCLRREKQRDFVDLTTNTYAPLEGAMANVGKGRNDVVEPPQTTGFLCSGPSTTFPVFLGYQHAAPANVLYDYNDELNMRSARRSALNIRSHDMMSIPEILPTPTPVSQKRGPWSSDEHERYCTGLEMFRYGSWKRIAEYVGTRTERQVQSHAQSIRAKRKRAENRRKRNGYGSSKTTYKSAKTTADEESLSSMQKLSLEELLIASMANKESITSNSGQMEKVSATVTAHSDVVASSISPTIAGVLSLELCCGDAHSVATKETNDMLLLPTEDCSKPYVDFSLDFDVPLCSSPQDHLLENIFSDEELFELLDITPAL